MIAVTYCTLRPQGLLVSADQVVSITEQMSKRSQAAVKANQTRKARKAKAAHHEAPSLCAQLPPLLAHPHLISSF